MVPPDAGAGEDGKMASGPLRSRLTIRVRSPQVLRIVVPLLVVVTSVTAQSAKAHDRAAASQPKAAKATAEVARGDSAYLARRVPEALAHYDSALAVEPMLYDALWRAAQARIDLAEADTVTPKALFDLEPAIEDASAAVAQAPSRIEGHFALARAMGRDAEWQPIVFARLRPALKAHQEAMACLAIDPRYPGCLHVLGEWNAQVAELGPGLGDVATSATHDSAFATASLGHAEEYLRAATVAEPWRAAHQLALGRVYAAEGKTALARAEFQTVLSEPLHDFNDPKYRAEARAALDSL